MKTNFSPTSTTASSSANADLLASPNPQNYAIPQVESIFNALADNGTLGTTPGGVRFDNVVESHIQGMAFYTNANGSFILLSHNDSSHECGKLIVLDVNGNSTQSYDSNPATSKNKPYFNHPSGIQVVGDFLVFPVANSNSSASHVDFYDLTQVGSTDNPGPQLQSDLRIDREGLDSPAAGMTYANGCYYVAVYGKSSVDIYQSNAVTSLLDANLKWSDPQNIKVKIGFDCLNLLTDTSNNVYLIGFQGVETPTTFDDYAYLYQLVSNDGKLELSHLRTKHMYTKNGTITTGKGAIYFRWGSGIQTFADGGLSLYCSARNFLLNGSAGLELQWNQWNQISSWQWSSDLGQPSLGGTIFGKTIPSVSIAKAAGTTVANGEANVLVVGSDGNLWTCFVSSNGWQWSCLGQPSGGISVQLPLGTVYSGGASNVLVVGSDGNAYTCFTDEDGGNWQWSGSLGQPEGVDITSPMGTVVSNNEANVLILGSDGNLWTCFVGSNGWQWGNLYNPSYRSNSGAATDENTGPQIQLSLGTVLSGSSPNIVVTGPNGTLVTCYISN